MDVSIIIVNYNTTSFLRKCLDSIIYHTKNIEYEIIVVDNNSPQRDIELLPEEYKTVRFLFRKVNDGFGAGCNFGVRYSKAKYLFFVNPDIIIKSNAIQEFFNYMNQHEEVVACSGLMENSEGEPIYSFNYLPNIYSELGEAFYFGFRRRIKKLLNKPELLNGKEFEIGYSLGALIFVRRDQFLHIYGFDERFFLYGEDIDLGFRLKTYGKIICLPYIRVYHYYTSSIDGEEGKFIESYHLNRSKLLYIYKHYNFIDRTLTRVFMIIGTSTRLVIIPFNGKYNGRKLNYFMRIFKSMLIFFERINFNNLGKFKN